MRLRFLLASACALAGCHSSSDAPPPAASAASASAAASVAAPASAAPSGQASASTGQPVAPEKIAAVVNPKNEPPYAGPKGTLRGVIRTKGDPPPDTKIAFPVGKCPDAPATYGKLFRVGQDKTLADVLVSVTQYQGYVAEAQPAERMEMHGCAFARRTMAVTFGQRIELANTDKLESYLPYLDGGRFTAMMVAVPGGDSVKYYPHEPGHYLLRDQLPKPWMVGDVFVLKYATHDVTDLDGVYEIIGIPVGKVRVDAILPITGSTAGQEVEIKEGDNKVDLTLEFDRKKLDKQLNPAASSKPAAPFPTAPKG